MQAFHLIFARRLYNNLKKKKKKKKERDFADLRILLFRLNIELNSKKAKKRISISTLQWNLKNKQTVEHES